MTPDVDWKRPAGVPANGAALWEDETWRDLDAGETMLLRSQVVTAMSRGSAPPEPSSPSFALAALGAAAVGLGVAATRKGGSRKRPTRRR